MLPISGTCCISFPALQTETVFSSLGKNCVRICTQNLLHIGTDVSGPLLAEVAVAVFSFIRDTYALNPALFIEFDSNNGYEALENILKRWDEQKKNKITLSFQDLGEQLRLNKRCAYGGHSCLKKLKGIQRYK